MNPTEQLEQVQNELLCSICYDYFLRAFTLSCSHSFCFNCITVWQANHHDCPICRSPIYSMAPSRALDNMVAAFNGNQLREERDNAPVVNVPLEDDNDVEDVLYVDSSTGSDIVDGDNDYFSDASSAEIDDRVLEGDYETDPELDYDNETDDNQGSQDSSYVGDDVDDFLSSSPLQESDVYESDDDSIFECSYPSALFPSFGIKSLEQW